MLHVVLDTNVLARDRPFGTNAYSRALEESSAGRLRLVVPELVLQEAINSWVKTVSELDRELSLAHRKLQRKGTYAGPLPDAVDLAKEARSLSASARAALFEAGALVPALPDVSHQTIVSRALDRRQPFDVAGRDGYRDVLLWQTILELVRAGHQVLLISNDRGAFAAGRKQDRVLAPSLAEEASEASGHAERVLLAHDLADALEELAASDQAIRDEAQEMFEDQEFSESFFELLATELIDTRLDRLELIGLGLPSSLLEARLRGDAWWDNAVEEFEVLYGRIGSDEETLVEIRLTQVQSIEVRFAADAYETVATTVDLGDQYLDEDAGVFRGTILARCLVRVDAAVSTEERIVDSAEVTAVEVVDLVT